MMKIFSRFGKRYQKLFVWLAILALVFQTNSGILSASYIFAQETETAETLPIENTPDEGLVEESTPVEEPTEAPEPQVSSDSSEEESPENQTEENLVDFGDLIASEEENVLEPDEIVIEEPNLTVVQGESDESLPEETEETSQKQEAETLKVEEPLVLDFQDPEEAAASAQINPTVYTDKDDYAPGETVTINGENFSPNLILSIKVTRPDGSVVKGDGSFEPGIDTVETNEEGKLNYLYVLNGIIGEYLVEVLDEGGQVLATTTFTDGPVVQVVQVVINEFLSYGSSDWVELFNNDSSIVDISNWYLEDTTSIMTTIPDGVSMAAGEYAVFEVSNRLNNAGDTVFLKDGGGSIINEVSYGSGATEDVVAPGSGESANRCPNGSGDWVISGTTTKNLVNACFIDQGPGEWDRSSLYFTGACQTNCLNVSATVCNGGDSQPMADSTDWELYWSAFGNPKDGVVISSGLVGPLGTGECQTISASVSPENWFGNYMFKAYQRPGHPGLGELWSDECSRCGDCFCPTPTPAPICGDGNLDAREECDDGNLEDGDGCSANCELEVPEVSQVTVCKYDSGQNPLSDWTMVLKGDHLEDVVVSSDGSTVSSSSLPAENLVLEPIGTYTYWPAQLTDAGIANAGYSLRPEGSFNPGPGPQWVSGDVLDSPWVGYLEVQVNSANVDWGYLTADHRYALGLAHSGGAISFNILDSNYGDNSGNIPVGIYQGWVGQTGENGCLTFPDVPFGQYDLEELIKFGWEQISGPENPVLIDETEENYSFTNRLGGFEPYCGDGIVNQGHEQCDDGNQADGDGCSADCVIEEETLGSITICKVIVDPENQIVDGSAWSGHTLSISGLNPNPVPSTGVPVGVLGTSSFTTPLVYDTDLFGNDRVYDADCQTYSDLPLGGYYYGQEVFPSARWLVPKYNDQFKTSVDSLSDFFTYSGELFDLDQNNDSARNEDADGHIVLSEGRPDRTLVVLNQYHNTCGNGVLEREQEEQCDDGNLDDGDGCSALCELEEISALDLDLAKWSSQDGRMVTFTLELFNNSSSTAYDPQIKDRLPRKFEYQTGTTLVNGVSAGDPSISGDSQSTGQFLVWSLGNLDPEETVTIEFEAEFEDGLRSGRYPNIAFALAFNLPNDPPGDEQLFTSRVRSLRREVSYSNFVVATVKIDKYDWPSTDIEGQVLGVSTVVGAVLGAATGAETIWFILAMGMIGFGLVMIFFDFSKVGLLRKKITQMSKKMLIFLACLLFFLAFTGGVLAVDSLYIQLMNLPEYSPSDYIDLYYNALERDNRSIEVRCYLRQDGGFGWRQFDDTQTDPAGLCQATNEDFEGDDLYFFKAVASGPDGSTESNETYTTLDRVRPENVKDYHKTRDSSMTYRVHWRTPDNGDFSFVRVYASQEQNFTANDSTKWEDIHGSPDEEFDHVFGGFEADKEYFFALQSFDKAGHYSQLIGDGGSAVYEEVVVESGAGSVVGAVGETLAEPQGQVLGGETEAATEDDEVKEDKEEDEDEAQEVESGLLGILTDEEGNRRWPLIIGGASVLGAIVYWFYRRRS
ncbi:DUF4215 domain-containing protein [Patescibacteria group bacterium]